jgi:Mrp family chromosome partitioning ATPase
MSGPRLAVLVGNYEIEQKLLPALRGSIYELRYRCLDAGQLLAAVESGEVDVALVSTGPHGLDAVQLTVLAQTRLAVVVLDPHPDDPRWASFRGMVVTPDSSSQQVVEAIAAALRGDRTSASATRPGSADNIRTRPRRPAGSRSSTPATPVAGHVTGRARVFTIAGGHGAPGRSTVAISLGALLGLVAETIVVDLDLVAGAVAARLRLNTSRNLSTVAHAMGSRPGVWDAIAGELQPLHPDIPHARVLPFHTDARDRLDAALLEALISSLRAHFEYVVIDTGVDWIAAGLAEPMLALPLQRADHVLLVATSGVAGVERARQARQSLRRLVPRPIRLGDCQPVPPRS